MGTPGIPESTSSTPASHADQPRIGPAMWFLLAGFLIPPAVVTFLGRMVGGLPHQTLWVILIGLPLPVLLFSMPRRYLIRNGQLIIQGLFYKIRIPVTDIRSIAPVSTVRAMVHITSFLCSDPGRALLLRRDDGFDLVFSPRDPAPFLALAPPTEGKVTP